MDLETLDIDRLRATLTMLQDIGVLEADLIQMRFKFPPPAPSIETVKATIDSPKADVPNGYLSLVGNKYLNWPKASNGP